MDEMSGASSKEDSFYRLHDIRYCITDVFYWRWVTCRQVGTCLRVKKQLIKIIEEFDSRCSLLPNQCDRTRAVIYTG